MWNNLDVEYSYVVVEIKGDINEGMLCLAGYIQDWGDEREPWAPPLPWT